MDKPSHAMLTVFRAVLRTLDTQTLADLRQRAVDLGEHPDGIEAIELELARRSGNPLR